MRRSVFAVHLKKGFPREFSDTLTLFNPNLSSPEKRVQLENENAFTVINQISISEGERDLLNDFIHIQLASFFLLCVRNIIDISSRTCDSQTRRHDLMGFNF
jgi:hypothetical protein